MLRKLLMTSALPLLFAVAAHADRDIPIQDLPAAVTSAIQKQYPNAKLIKAEEDTAAGGPHFDVKIQAGDKRRELHIQPNGTIIKDEMED